MRTIPNKNIRIRFCVIPRLFFLALVPWTLCQPGTAEDFVVTAVDDTGPGTLRQALEDAALNGEGDTISFTVTGTIELMTLLPRIEEDLQILGPGADLLTVRRASGTPDFFFGIFYFGGGVTATLSGLTIANGRSQQGAALWNLGDLLLEGCTISGNRSSSVGNVYNVKGNLEVRNCLLTGNTADSGAALANLNGTTLLVNTTVSANTATSAPGISNVILNFSSATATMDIFNCTITQNTASEGGQIYNDRTTRSPATIRFRSSIVAGNFGNVPDVLNLFGTIVSLGHNFIGDNRLVGAVFPPGLPNPNSDFVGTFDDEIDPDLQPLEDNGGPTATHLPRNDSLVIDTGVATAVTGSTDQRGEPRTGDGDCDLVVAPDIGSAELQDCRRGTVNRGAGLIQDVLFVNDSVGTGVERCVVVGLNESIDVRLDAAPAGPVCGFYVLYVWRGEPINPQAVAPTGFFLGYAINPIPLQRLARPQPFLCVRGDGVPAAVCRGVREIQGTPPKTPWVVTRSQGFGNPLTLTLQAIVEDIGAADPVAISVSNAIVLKVRP